MCHYPALGTPPLLPSFPGRNAMLANSRFPRVKEDSQFTASSTLLSVDLFSLLYSLILLPELVLPQLSLHCLPRRGDWHFPYIVRHSISSKLVWNTNSITSEIQPLMNIQLWPRHKPEITSPLLIQVLKSILPKYPSFPLLNVLSITRFQQTIPQS